MGTHADWIDAPAPHPGAPGPSGKDGGRHRGVDGHRPATAELLLENGARVVALSRVAHRWTRPDLLGLTTGLSRELGREGIRVNTVSPGWVFTERQVEEYFAGPEAAKFLDYLS